jgi:hypothetical protein
LLANHRLNFKLPPFCNWRSGHRFDEALAAILVSKRLIVIETPRATVLMPSSPLCPPRLRQRFPFVPLLPTPFGHLQSPHPGSCRSDAGQITTIGPECRLMRLAGFRASTSPSGNGGRFFHSFAPVAAKKN